MAEQDAEALQFDNAEYDTPAPSTLACAACKQPIPDAYYELFGAVVCEPCKDLIIASREGGSRVGRFLKAGIFGAAAAVAGFGIYFGVLKLTQLEVGLISILVGWMVGKAVQRGSNGRGGWLYQLMAMFLTYSAVAASYSAVHLPGLIAEMRAERAAEKEAAAKKADPAAKKADPAAVDDEGAKIKDMSPAKLAIAIVVVVALFIGFAYALPILVGMQNPIGLLIVGFAIWEAWKINKRVPMVFSGPFAVGGNVGGEAQLEPGGHA
jgi:hypothetical protein